MEKEIKRGFLKKPLWWILGIIGAFLITKILEWAIPKLEIFKTIKEFLLIMTIPDYFLLILIIAFFIWMVFQKRKIKNEARKEIKKELKKLEKKEKDVVTDEVDKYKEFFKYSELLFILDLLAQQRHSTLEKSHLLDYFNEKFPDQAELGFHIVLNDAEKLDFITTSEYGGYEESCWIITSKGLDCLKQYLISEKNGLAT